MKNLILIWAILFSSLAQAYPLGTKGAGQSSASYPATIDFGDQAITTTGSNVKVVSANSKNYITAIDGSKIGNWVTYADAAGTSPVDGTGGSPTVTFAVSTDSSLRGSTNFLFTHGASNQQGQGASYNFTIDPADTGKVVRIDFDYMVASGTYADDDLQFWIYDVTNSALIQPAPFKLKNTLIKDHFAGEFQTTTSTSYRLIGHVSTSTATAYTLRFTNWSVGVGAKVYSTGETLYSALVSSTGVVSQQSPSGWLVTPATVNNTSQYLLVPSTGTFSVNPNCWAQYKNNTSGVIISSWIADVLSTADIRVHTYAGGASTANDFWVFCKKQGVDYANATSGRLSSSEADTRVVAAYAGISAPATLTTTFTNVTYAAATYDTHNGFSSSGYTVQSPGYYRVKLKYSIGNTAVNYASQILKNGSAVSDDFWHIGNAGVGTSTSHEVTLKCNANDVITAQLGTASGTASIGGRSLDGLYIEKVQGPSQIQASETVAASYWVSAASFVSSATIPINFDSKEYDSHGSVTTSATAWKFTAPISGTYTIKAKVDSGSNVGFNIYKNGSSYKYFCWEATSTDPSCSTDIKLLGGEYFDIRANSSATMVGGALNANNTNMTVIRSGNY